MTTIHILKCADDRYYIDRTDKINESCQWLQKYPSMEIERVIESDDEFDVDKWVLKYMTIHGISYVRGGSFKEPDLDSNTMFVIMDIIQKTVGSCTDRCYMCHADLNENRPLQQNQPINENRPKNENKYEMYYGAIGITILVVLFGIFLCYHLIGEVSYIILILFEVLFVCIPALILYELIMECLYSNSHERLVSFWKNMKN